MLSLPGQSVLGVFLVNTHSKVPAHASRLVKKSFKLKIFFTVAGIDECSYSDVGCGPDGPCNTAFPIFSFVIVDVVYKPSEDSYKQRQLQSNFVPFFGQSGGQTSSDTM